MSKTMAWKKQASFGNFADAETFPSRREYAGLCGVVSSMTSRGDE